jgi:hypothetical protein
MPGSNEVVLVGLLISYKLLDYLEKIWITKSVPLNYDTSAHALVAANTL